MLNEIIKIIQRKVGYSSATFQGMLMRIPRACGIACLSKISQVQVKIFIALCKKRAISTSEICPWSCFPIENMEETLLTTALSV